MGKSIPARAEIEMHCTFPHHPEQLFKTSIGTTLPIYSFQYAPTQAIRRVALVHELYNGCPILEKAEIAGSRPNSYHQQQHQICVWPLLICSLLQLADP